MPRLFEGGVLEKGQVGLLEGNGAEAVVPLHNNKKWISAVANDMKGTINGAESSKIDELLELLYSYLPAIAKLQVRLDSGELVGALVGPMDEALGELAFKKGRGY